MRSVVVLLLAGCGRLGFGANSGADATTDAMPDGGLDAPTDAPGFDTLFYMAFDDDPADGTIDDTSGHGFTASCVAGVSCPTAVAGKRGMGLRFNGSQYAVIPYRSELATQDAFTIATWVMIETANTDHVAIGKPVFNGSQDSWALVAWANVETRTCIETTSAFIDEWACAPGALPTNTWYHLAGTWDGTLKRLYINGTLTKSIMGTPVDIDTHDIILGGDQNSGALAYPWHGRIDEVRFYDRALTSLEIQAIAAP